MLGIIDNKFIIGRDEFFPFSAEIHYFRVEKRYWSICFERIKKAGFRIISTYVPWNLHEEQAGEFDFKGYSDPRKDLIVFLELAREFGFKVILKPGPWMKAEWPNGALPKYLFSDESIVARDLNGELVSAENGISGKSGYQPSYTHPKYLNHIKRYLSALIEVVQNYIFPKGPVFLIQIDDELSFGGNLKPFSADYNNYTITEHYHTFLEEKYKETKNIPSCYGKKIKEFSYIEPPISLEAKEPGDMIRYFDWIEFKGYLVSQYVQTIKERLEAHGLGCFFSLNLAWTGDFALPSSIDNLSGEKMVIGMKIPEPDDYCRLSRNLRYLSGKTGFCWTPQLYGGLPSSKTDSEKHKSVLNPRYHRYLIVSSLAAGLKGMNHYMFVGRDNWSGAPLNYDGSVNENYDTIRKLNTVLEHIGINTAKPVSQVAIAYHKPYLVQNHLELEDQFPYVRDLVTQTLNPLGLDFMNLKYDYNVIDIDSGDSLTGKSMYFIPTAEYMAKETQEKIVEAVRKGKNVVLFGLLPKYDLDFKTCKILQKGIGLSTVEAWAPSNITIEKKDFKAIRFGFISSLGGGKAIAKCSARIVGVKKKVGKGTVYLFTFNISPKYDPSRMNLLQTIFDTHKITSPVKTSDPTVDLIAQENEHGVILYLINTDVTFTSAYTTFKKKVVVSIDLSALGIKTAKIKLFDVLDNGEVTYNAKELKEGVIFSVGYHEAKIFYIPKK